MAPEPPDNIMNRNETVLKIAEAISKKGGRAYYVGGCVRDALMGRDSKDIDIEVFGLTKNELKEVLDTFGETLEFGASFGIFSLKNLDLDIAMPRKERTTGLGHRDFDVSVDPFLKAEDAAKRRDFTINAIMKDVLTGELIDPYSGKNDIEKGIIRHVWAESFIDDPLRVFRAAQFASRFDFEVCDETVDLCKGMDLKELSRERVEEELRKALMLSNAPSKFFEVLRKMDQLDPWFKEVGELIGLEQDPIYHPEGDVWNHTMEVLDRGADLKKDAEEPYGFMLLCLTHDLGKMVTTTFEKGRIHAYGHETEGLWVVERFLDRIIGKKALKNYVLGMIPSHMKPNMVSYNKSKLKVTNRMFDGVPSPNDLILFAMADRPVMAGNDGFMGDRDFLEERLKEYNKLMEKPYVKGQDLLDSGLEPGEDFHEILEYAHKLRLAGIEKELALKQTLVYARQLREKERH